ncbi:MAG: tetratricopeptide repeat protein [Sulfuricaulis sp.]
MDYGRFSVSLINKMLQDLESRQNPRGDTAEKKSVYDGLKPVQPAGMRASARRLYVILAVILVVGAGAYAWMQWGDRLLRSRVLSDKPLPVATLHVPPKPVTVRIPSPAAIPPPKPTVVAAATPVPAMPANFTQPQTAAQNPNVPPLAKAAAPIIAQTVKDETTTPAAAPPPAPSVSPGTAKNRSQAVANGGYWIVARGDTVYGISIKSGIDLWDLSKWNHLGRKHVIYTGQRLRLTPPGSVGVKSSAHSVKTPNAEKPTKPNKAAALVAAADKAPGADAAPPALAKITDDRIVSSGTMDKQAKPLSVEEKAESEYRLAVNLLQQGRPEEAESHLKSALHISAAHTKARELLAGLMLQNGHWREAEQSLEQGLQKVPAYFPFAQLLARIDVDHGSDQKALAVLEGNREAGSGNADYMAFLALLYQRTGNQTAAINAYTAALRLDPQQGRTWVGLGISLEAARDWKAAATAYQRAIDTGVLDDGLKSYASQRLAAIKNK